MLQTYFSQPQSHWLQFNSLRRAPHRKCQLIKAIPIVMHKITQNRLTVPRHISSALQSTNYNMAHRGHTPKIKRPRYHSIPFQPTTYHLLPIGRLHTTPHYNWTVFLHQTSQTNRVQLCALCICLVWRQRPNPLVGLGWLITPWWLSGVRSLSSESNSPQYIYVYTSVFPRQTPHSIVHPYNGTHSYAYRMIEPPQLCFSQYYLQ